MEVLGGIRDIQTGSSAERLPVLVVHPRFPLAAPRSLARVWMCRWSLYTLNPELDHVAVVFILREYEAAQKATYPITCQCSEVLYGIKSRICLAKLPTIVDRQHSPDIVHFFPDDYFHRRLFFSPIILPSDDKPSPTLPKLFAVQHRP